MSFARLIHCSQKAYDIVDLPSNSNDIGQVSEMLQDEYIQGILCELGVASEMIRKPS